MLLALLCCLVAWAQDRDAWLDWQARQQPVEHAEPAYQFAAEVHARLAPLVREWPGRVDVREIGRTVQKRPIWAFVVRDPGVEAHQRVLVFANIHAMEWISTEVATAFLEDLIRHPVKGVEVTVIPILNADGRWRVEQDLLAGTNAYRRSNANGVDLNRDFAVNREARAIWRHLIPSYYTTSPAPLSQPESQAIDALADEQRFHAAVSLHAFGGFLYYPWAGAWCAPPDDHELYELGQVMAAGQGAHAYRTRQLSRWGFFFRGHGMEIDHLYGKYGTRAFLIELTRSGLSPFRPGEWRYHFRWYNPRDPAPHVERGSGALHALVWHLAVEPIE